ncbi:peptidase G2 autoproteolytic cleavage domain-containing protein [Paenibacillus sp. V4I7]|uniref:peptidase G2 autoproteolytic cleavage domain-containing protein n=1 Tax=Paenibacillus sp. V4I7 TaxID=3042307 RepID=UPI002788D6B4|nr:peptidase G2 autoproteolytic cleavage domain-containing protein [Paenibacillus sp. V4I7]MDQ0901546.1 hypothetical protein [Paenibacillus sp. V4I7]
MAFCNAQALGACSEAEGNNTIASGGSSHAEGLQTVANATASHAEGYLTRATGPASHAEGGAANAIGLYSHAEGRSTRSFGDHSHAEGLLTVASGLNAHAEGELTEASGLDSHAEGLETTASGQSSHAEGENNSAIGRAAHAEGNLTAAGGLAAHAEGQSTNAGGDLSHAEGNQTTASGQSSHAEGALTTASGFTSHAQGVSTIANSFVSHAEGQSTSTNNLEGVHIMGQFGSANELSYSWYLANGTSAATPGLAAKILSNGNVKIDGTVSSPAADYAEMFETVDGKPIEPGYFVTVEEDKVRIAVSSDFFVIGITSATPAFLSDSGELRWKHKFLTDEWGRILYEDVIIPAEFGETGTVITPERMVRRPLLNPAWHPAEEYTSRLERPEWVAVGLLGKLLVRDDGTCRAGGYCRPNHNGIATSVESGYYVLRRTLPNQILVLVR